MTVAELIEKLQKLDPSLLVYVYADHGQTNEGVYDVSIDKTCDELDGAVSIEDAIAPDDYDLYDDLNDFVCISS